MISMKNVLNLIFYNLLFQTNDCKVHRQFAQFGLSCIFSILNSQVIFTTFKNNLCKKLLELFCVLSSLYQVPIFSNVYFVSVLLNAFIYTTIVVPISCEVVFVHHVLFSIFKYILIDFHNDVLLLDDNHFISHYSQCDCRHRPHPCTTILLRT